MSQVPILFISSASDNMNVVMAVNMGGDDFVVKPFDLEILQAKIQALLRRAYAFTAPGNILEYRGVILNMTDMSLSCRKKAVQPDQGEGVWPMAAVSGGKDAGEGKAARRIELTKNEFRILQTLFEAAGGVVSRDLLMKRLWDDECFVDDNTLTVNMNRLRKRLRAFRADPDEKRRWVFSGRDRWIRKPAYHWHIYGSGLPRSLYILWRRLSF